MPDLLHLLSFGPEGWGDEILAGTWLTIRLALATLPFGLVLGFFVALAKRSEARVAALPRRGLLHDLPRACRSSSPSSSSISARRCGFQWLVRLFSDATVEISGFVAGVIALGVVFAAYASEVFTAAFNGIAEGAMGGRRRHRPAPRPDDAARRLPAAHAAGAARARQSLADPPEGHLARLRHLDQRPLRMTYQAVSYTKQPFFLYFVACMIYLVMSIISSFGITAIERWAERGERARTATRPTAHVAPAEGGGAMIPDLLQRYGLKLLDGLGVTLELVVISIVCGAILAIPIAMARLSKNRIISGHRLRLRLLLPRHAAPRAALPDLLRRRAVRRTAQGDRALGLLPRRLQLRRLRLHHQHRRLPGGDLSRRHPLGAARPMGGGALARPAHRCRRF